MSRAWVNWLVVAVALLVSVAGALGPFDAPPRLRSGVDWASVAGEGALLFGACISALLIHRFGLPGQIRRLFFFAALFFLVAQGHAVLDEFFLIGAYLPGFIGNAAKIVGIGTLAAALFELVGTMRRTHAEREAFRAASRTDSLTGLGNRQQMDAVLGGFLAGARRGDEALSVVFIDVDDFKRTNDIHGHAVGDIVLQDLAEILRRTVRSADHAFRLGGEEFLLVLSATARAGAQRVAERVRGRYGALTLETEAGPWRGTLSLGVAEFRAGDSVESLLRRADEAMYLAKRSGKNRVALDTEISASVP